MGMWSTDPFGNDDAADWACQLARNTKIFDQIREGLHSENNHVMRAAVMLLKRLAIPYLYPVDRLAKDIETAQRALHAYAEYLSEMGDEEILAAVVQDMEDLKTLI